MMFCVTGVGIIPSAVRTNNGSSNSVLSLDRELDTAGWVMPMISPARVRFPSVYMALNTTKRFRSISLSFMVTGSHISFFDSTLVGVFIEVIQAILR